MTGPKLRPGTVTIDLTTGGIYGDKDRNPRENLLESSEALLSLLPKVRHKGLWGLGKAFDSDCYLYTTDKKYKAPEGLEPLATNIGKGPVVGDPESCRSIPDRPFRLTVFNNASREKHWQYDWYSKVVGSVKDGHASPETGEVPDHYRKGLEHSAVGSGTAAAPKKATEPELVQQKLF